MPELPEHIIDPTAGPKLFMRSPDGNTLKELHLDDTGELSLGGSKIRDKGLTEMVIALTDHTRPYVKCTSSSYKTVAYFPFRGSSVLGVPTIIEVLSMCKASNKVYDVRIVRSDNGDVIAESTLNDNIDIEIKNLGTLYNIPTGPAILEIQSKVDNGGEARISAVSIQF